MASRKPPTRRPVRPRKKARSTRRRDLSVAVAGFGAIGRKVAEALDRGIPGLRLAAVSARDLDRVRVATAKFTRRPKVVSLKKLAAHADVIVECVPAAAFTQVAEPALRAGKTLLVISVGALVGHPEIAELARKRGRIVVPTGALIGLDAVAAAAEGTIHSVRMITRKPPKGLEGAPHLVQNAISVAGLNGPLKVFEGSARDAVRGFPANVNVAAALSLAGIGPDRTTIEIWAEPGIERNMHSIMVESDSARFSMSIENIPSEENPRTGRITALSIIAALRKLVSPVRVGT